METKEQKLTISELRKYIDEWFSGTISLVILKNSSYDSFDFIIKETTNGNVIFSSKYKYNDYYGEDKTMCSTAEIINAERRGLIEQCIELDKQLAKNKVLDMNIGEQKAQ